MQYNQKATAVKTIYFTITLLTICLSFLQAGVTGAAMSGVVAGETQKSHTGIPVLHAGSHFRHGLLQLMIHTIDPMHDGKNRLKMRTLV